MRGVRAIALCGAIILLVTACEQANQAKGAVMKVVQRFRGGDTTKVDSAAADTSLRVAMMDTATNTATKTATKAPASSQATKTGATATKTGATRTGAQQPTGTTPATQQSKAPSSRMASTTRTAPTSPRTETASMTTKAGQPSAPANTMATTTVPGSPKPAARGPRDLTDVEKEALDDLGSQYATEFELHPGWFRDHSVRYYDFGPTPQPIAPGRVIWPVYGFDSKGNPVAIRGQRPIFSGVPGVGGYSGFWRLWYLVVADHVTPNELRDETSADVMVRRRRAFLKPSDMVLNLPIVARGSRLVGDSTPSTYGWFKGREVQYFDFGTGSISPFPLFAFTTGTDANGDPEFLRAQANVVDTVPARVAAPDLWSIQLVRVDSTYRPNSLRNANAVVGSGARIESTHSWRNCPVVIVDDTRAARGVSPLRTYADDRSPLPPSPTITP